MKVLCLVLGCLAVSLGAPVPSIFTIAQNGVGFGIDIVAVRWPLKPVVDWHYVEDQVVFMQSQEYLAPDETYFTPTPGGNTNDVIQVIHSANNYVQDYLAKDNIFLSGTVNGVPLNSSFNGTKNEANQYLTNGTTQFALTETYAYAFQMELWPGFTVDPIFKASVDSLPQKYDFPVYRDWLQTWWTHYLDKVQYGGKYNFTNIFDDVLLQNYSLQWIVEEIRLSIDFEEQKYGIPGFNGSQPADPVFQAHSHTVHYVVGGNIDMFETTGFEAWFKSLQTMWGVILDGSSAAPMFELVDWDVVRSKNILQATIDYGNGKST